MADQKVKEMEPVETQIVEIMPPDIENLIYVVRNKSLKAENPDFYNSEIHDPKDQENIKENKENKEMTTITVNVTGMMCGHCEAHVTKAVREAFGVEDVVSDRKSVV